MTDGWEDRMMNIWSDREHFSMAEVIPDAPGEDVVVRRVVEVPRKALVVVRLDKRHVLPPAVFPRHDLGLNAELGGKCEHVPQGQKTRGKNGVEPTHAVADSV